MIDFGSLVGTNGLKSLLDGDFLSSLPISTSSTATFFNAETPPSMKVEESSFSKRFLPRIYFLSLGCSFALLLETLLS